MSRDRAGGTRRVARRTFLKAAPAVAAATGAAATGLATFAPAALAAAPASSGTAQAGTSPAGGGSVVVPPGWGQFIGPRLAAAAAGTGKATVALVGDSVCRGYFASSLGGKGWGALVGAGLRAAYGDGGSGFQGTSDSAAWMQGVTGLSSPATISYYQAAGDLLTATGAWASKTAGWIAPGGVALETSDPSASLSATVRGTSAKVVWLDGGATAFGAFSVSVDGGTPTVVKPTGVYRIGVTRLTGLAAGSHTIQITATGATPTTQTVIIGVAGENDTGCLVNQFSRYGQSTVNLDNSDPMAAGTWYGGWNYPADLVVFSLGANDARAGVPGDAWARNVRCWLSGVRDTTFGGASTGAVDGVLVLPHIGRYDAGQYVFQDYAVRAAGIAASFGLLLVDLWAAGRNSWNCWHHQPEGSYWANGASPGQPGTDVVHLSDAGHQFVASTVLGAITANLPA